MTLMTFQLKVDNGKESTPRWTKFYCSISSNSSMNSIVDVLVDTIDVAIIKNKIKKPTKVLFGQYDNEKKRCIRGGIKGHIKPITKGYHTTFEGSMGNYYV